MADTRLQKNEIEEWVRDVWSRKRFGQRFVKRNVDLNSGGSFEFDAVSADGGIVAVISTSGTKTATRKRAPGKMNKIRSDILFLLLAKADRKLVVFTERDMYEWWNREDAKGRVPGGIEFKLVEIPEDLRAYLFSGWVRWWVDRGGGQRRSGSGRGAEGPEPTAGGGFVAARFE